MCCSFVILVAFILIIQPLLQLDSARTLPLQIWLPNNISNSLFWEFYVFNSISTIIGTLPVIVHDCLFAASLHVVCDHLDILSQRMKTFPGVIQNALEKNVPQGQVEDLEHGLFSQFIKDHREIYQ